MSLWHKVKSWWCDPPKSQLNGNLTLSNGKPQYMNGVIRSRHDSGERSRRNSGQRSRHNSGQKPIEPKPLPCTMTADDVKKLEEIFLELKNYSASALQSFKEVLFIHVSHQCTFISPVPGYRRLCNNISLLLGHAEKFDKTQVIECLRIATDLQVLKESFKGKIDAGIEQLQTEKCEEYDELLVKIHTTKQAMVETRSLQPLKELLSQVKKYEKEESYIEFWQELSQLVSAIANAHYSYSYENILDCCKAATDILPLRQRNAGIVRWVVKVDKDEYFRRMPKCKSASRSLHSLRSMNRDIAPLIKTLTLYRCYGSCFHDYVKNKEQAKSSIGYAGHIHKRCRNRLFEGVMYVSTRKEIFGEDVLKVVLQEALQIACFTPNQMRHIGRYNQGLNL